MGDFADYRGNTGVVLRAALSYKGWTHADLAKAIGVAPNTVSRWVRGDSEMKAAYVAVVADALDVPVELLVRPPATRDEALLTIAAWRGVRRGLQQPG